MRTRTKITDDLRNTVCGLRQRGTKINDIVSITGTCKSTVQSILKKADLQQKRQPNFLRVEDVKKYTHLTRLKLAIKFRVSYQSMGVFLQRHKIEVAPSRPGRKPANKPKIEEPKPVTPIKRHKPEYHRINKGIGIAAELHNW